VSDIRIGEIECLIRRSLNDDAAPFKVYGSDISLLLQLTAGQGGLGAVNSRVYAVKVAYVHDYYVTLIDVRCCLGQSQPSA
jgi:hypothetical protein